MLFGIRWNNIRRSPWVPHWDGLPNRQNRQKHVPIPTWVIQTSDRGTSFISFPQNQKDKKPSVSRGMDCCCLVSMYVSVSILIIIQKCPIALIVYMITGQVQRKRRGGNDSRIRSLYCTLGSQTTHLHDVLLLFSCMAFIQINPHLPLV